MKAYNHILWGPYQSAGGRGSTLVIVLSCSEWWQCTHTTTGCQGRWRVGRQLVTGNSVNLPRTDKVSAHWEAGPQSGPSHADWLTRTAVERSTGPASSLWLVSTGSPQCQSVSSVEYFWWRSVVQDLCSNNSPPTLWYWHYQLQGQGQSLTQPFYLGL